MSSPIDAGTVLITGASSGIGRAIATYIVHRAKVIILVARRIPELESLKQELLQKNAQLQVHVFSVDLTVRESIEQMCTKLKEHEIQVDVLINNAGFGNLSAFDLSESQTNDRMIALNITSLVFLTHYFLQGMIARKKGGILNISSGYGLTFVPGFAVYVGTKHFVTGFTDSLRCELRGTGVIVSQSCPGPVATEFAENVGNFTGQDVPKVLEITAAQCAKSSIRAFDRDAAMVVPGFLMKILIWLGYRTPRFLMRWIYSPLGRTLRQKQLSLQPPRDRST